MKQFLNNTKISLILLCAYIVSYSFLLRYTYRDDRPADGVLSLGFPFAFYFGGGHCTGSSGPYFYTQYFVYDCMIFLIPIGLYLLIRYLLSSK